MLKLNNDWKHDVKLVTMPYYFVWWDSARLWQHAQIVIVLELSIYINNFCQNLPADSFIAVIWLS